MSQLWLRRHAESQWNRQRRIQGGRRTPGLSREGMNEARRWAASLVGEIHITAIWSSDLDRARHTAAPAARVLGLPVTTTPLLREVGAGVLEGLTHDEARSAYPAAYRVWTSRGDLDEIPGAEPGDALQARALAFLALVGGPDAVPGTHLAVAHGALLRCIVNTCTARHRTTPVEVAHGFVHRVSEPWNRLMPRNLNHPWRDPAYRIGSYLVKMATRVAVEGLDQYLAVRAAIAGALGSPPVLAAGADPTSDRVIFVRRFVEGSTVDHRVRSDDEWRLHRLYQSANRATSMAARNDGHLLSVADRVEAVLSGPDSDARRGLRRLVSDSRVRALIEKRCGVSDFDLHRDNTVRTPAGELVKIDFDSLCTGPHLWPEACALVGASALYPPGGDAARPHTWLHTHDSVHAAELRILMTIRMLLGLSFFVTGRRSRGGLRARAYAALYRQALDAFVPEAGWRTW
jgi:broad specificity phosphatase PhoE